MATRIADCTRAGVASDDLHPGTIEVIWHIRNESLLSRLPAVQHGSRSWLLSGLGMLILLFAIVFWWGAVFGTQIFSLVFPQVLSPESIHDDLNPDRDGTLANTVSTAAFLIFSMLALANVVTGHRRKSGLAVVGGWIVLAMTAIILAVEDLDALIIRRQHIIAVGDHQVHWMLLVSPLIIAFLIAMLIFILNVRHSGEVRALLTLGILVWILALLYDAVPDFLGESFAWTKTIASPLEETLEFGGVLLLGLSGEMALRRRSVGIFRPRLLFSLLIGILGAVALLGILVIAFVFRAPFVDARSGSQSDGNFYIELEGEMSAVQEFRMPESPIGELKIRMFNQNLHGRTGIVIWRVIDGGLVGEFLREGRLEVAARDYVTAWDYVGMSTIELDPPLSGDGGRLLGLQIVAEVDEESRLRVAATKANLYATGRLWVNGEMMWADQDLEFVAYSAAEPTRSKLQAVWGTVSSDWLWPVLLVALGLALVLVTLIPALVLARVVLPVTSRRS